MEIPGKSPDTFRQFVRFCLTPRPIRDARFGLETDREFAEQHGLSQRTLCRWRKTDAFQVATRAAEQAWGERPVTHVVGEALS